MYFNLISRLLAISVCLVLSLSASNGAKILFFLGLSTRSHRVAIQPLADSLSEKGHDVTFFSPIEPEITNPKIKEFCPKALKDITEKIIDDGATATALKRLEDRHFEPHLSGNNIFDSCLLAQEVTLKSPEFTEWLNTADFDLIIYDHMAKEFLYPLAWKMNAKIIAFIPFVLPLFGDEYSFGLPVESWTETMLGNRYWFVPDRYFNTLSDLSWYFSYRDYYLPKAEALSREALGFDFPSFEQLLKNTDLVLLNDHFSAGYSKPYPPFVVPVGGMHAKKSNGTLPADMESFLDDVDKFIYFSFGSAASVAKLPISFRKVLFDTIESIAGTKFLWKWDGDTPEDMPKNAFGKSWFPQQDVLAHPKCKGFVTQGGVMSLQQSVFHGVPVLVVPGFGDQPYNARMAANLGYGIYMELADITVETFSSAIHQLLENPKFATNMKEASRLFKDRPLSAVDTAVWWTEYVLRHDTTHLKSGAVHQTWWQKRSLDLWLITFSLAASLVVLSVLMTSKLVRMVLSSFESRKSKQS